jgi:uncharacterized protein (TIGR00369 family)
MPQATAPHIALSGLSDLLGIRVVKAARESVTGVLDARAEHLGNAGKRLNGGLLMTFGDTLGAVGTTMNMPAGCWTSTIESKTNFLAAGKPGRLRGEAVPIHIGQTTQVWRTDITDSRGALVATVTQTQLVLPSRDTQLKSKRTLAVGAGNSANKKVTAGSVSAQRRQQIFEAASQVFGEKGFANASVREVADAAGMPVPTMYQYFRSKEDILSLLFETYMLEIGAALRAAMESEASAKDKLRAALTANINMYDKYRSQIRLMYQETRSLGSENRSRALTLTHDVNRIWAEIIKAGVASGEFQTKSHWVVANFIPMLCATWVLRRWNLKGVPLKELKELVTDFVMGALSGGKPASTRPVARRKEGSAKRTKAAA